MLDKSELLEAIDYCEDHIDDYNSCMRLASLYTIYDHKFKKRFQGEPIGEVIVQDCGDSEFLSAIRGRNASEMWCIMNDLMQVISDNDPSLYNKIISKINH